MGTVLRRGKARSKKTAPGTVVSGSIMKSERQEWENFTCVLVQYHAALNKYKSLTDNWFKITNEDGQVADIEVVSVPAIDSLIAADSSVNDTRLLCARAIVALQDALYTGGPPDEDLYRQAATHNTSLLGELKRVEKRYFGGPLIGNLPIFISDAELNELLDIDTTFSLVRQHAELTRDKERA